MLVDLIVGQRDLSQDKAQDQTNRGKHEAVLAVLFSIDRHDKAHWTYVYDLYGVRC